jgi:hypothetical protein
MPEPLQEEAAIVPFCAGQPEPSPRRREAYQRYAPAIPAGESSEVQVLGAQFVHAWLLAWRIDAGAWWQMDDDSSGRPDAIEYEPLWEPRSEGEVRAFCFGFLAGARCQAVTGRSKLVDGVLREAKLLPWPHGQNARNDLTGWVREYLRPTELGVGSIATEAVTCRLLREFPLLASHSRRSLEMRLAGAINEAWGHERGVRRAQGIMHENRPVRGWMGLEFYRGAY